MNRLSDAQLVVLAAACQRADRNVLPLPERMKGGAAQKIVASLIGKGLIEEVAAGSGEPVWREGDDGGRFTLRAFDFAFQALGIEPEDGAASDGVEQQGATGREADGPAATPAQAATSGDEPSVATGEPSGEEPALSSPAVDRVRKTRTDTKQAQIVSMLKQPDGASLDEIIAVTGWQKHTVRGAIAGALKKKLGLAITSGKAPTRGTVYRIAG